MGKDLMLDIGRALGKREMLLYIQRACIAKGGTLTLEDINKYSQVCAVDEMVYPVDEYSFDVDKDIRAESIRIANM
jgi:hypothetical protein